MADDQPLDPAKLMRGFFAAWDRQGPAAADQAADAPAMRLMGQALAVANMPSREDIGALADRLDRIEALLGHIDRRLADLERKEPAAGKRKKKR